jgi:ABC-type polysaccharide/polyol phosphate export permease
MPLLNTILFSVIFVKVVKLVGIYPVFAYCGLLAWNLTARPAVFRDVADRQHQPGREGGFPREIFPFSAVFVSAVDYLVGGFLLVGMMIYYRVPARPRCSFCPSCCSSRSSSPPPSRSSWPWRTCSIAT